MTSGNVVVAPQIAEILDRAIRLTLKERLLVARYLLDSVLTKEIDDETDWQNLGLAAFQKAWGNEEDAIYDNWREIYLKPDTEEGQTVTHLRPFGLCAGEFVVPDDFDDPLPAEILKMFEGE